MKRIYRFFVKKYPRLSGTLLLVLLIAYWLCLPNPLFKDPTCMVIEDREGQLLGARIAADGQWRFPHQTEIPDKFAQAIIAFEDKRFYRHIGVDLWAILRAVRQNLSQGRIVSGGSTLSMQVIRLARKGQGRTLYEKVIEAIQATRLELRYSKADILAFYASHAPFGGNVVGLDAAAWRYYGKKPALLSWAEAATLAVLPNSPSLIHPGRNRSALLNKRNRLLLRLHQQGQLDQLSYELALEEPLPDQPLPLPRLAPHLLDRAYTEQFRGQQNKATRLRSSLSRDLQEQSQNIAARHHRQLAGNGIHNLAILVMEVESGQVLAYVGNAPGTGAAHGEAVDIIKAPRSTGSILKPFLYAMMQEEGELLPNSLVPDIPTYLNGYRPENFHQSYDGRVPAQRALIRSLNVPMVHMLQQYGLEKFHSRLRRLGFTSFNKPPEHYGLSIILGGGEASLWEITSAYASMGRSLRHFYPYDGRYDKNDFRMADYSYQAAPPKVDRQALDPQPLQLSAAASWLAFRAMQKVERPNSQGEWQYFRSSQRIAWKTGTSFGFRDAWAVGLTADYAVGVWVGNADGEGRPGLVGVQAAAPVLFDVFAQLPSGDWFEQPFDEMRRIPVCKQSGYRALALCEADSLWVAEAGLKVGACPFHKLVHLDATEQWQVNSDCEAPSTMVHRPWFVLPAVEEHYYKSQDPNYEPLPPFRPDCRGSLLAGEDRQPMQFIYPTQSTKIMVPVDLNGQRSKTVFKIAHRDPATKVHWHLDEEYVGSTQHFHHLELDPPEGQHWLTLVDDKGYEIKQRFEIIDRQ
ncbi:MAG: penicillin-binding protein 1C [Bacteroidota bacterium]